MTERQSLISFAESVRRRRGVEPALAALEREFSLPAPLLLAGLWAAEGGRRLDPAGARELRALAEGWQGDESDLLADLEKRVIALNVSQAPVPALANTGLLVPEMASCERIGGLMEAILASISGE